MNHEPRCTGECGPCGGVGQVGGMSCLSCGGSGRCSGCRPTDTPAVFFRRNRSQWYVAVPAEYYLELVAMRERAL